MRSRLSPLAGIASFGLALALLAAACGSDQPAATSGQPTPSPKPLPQATLSPDSIDLLHLADEPYPRADHLDPVAHGLTADYRDPYGVFTEKVPPGALNVTTSAVFDGGLYRAPVTVYLPAPTATDPAGQPEIDAFTLPELQTTVDPADIERRVVAWESQRLSTAPAAGGGSVSLVGQRTGTFRGLPAMVFKLRAGGVQLKVLTLVLGHSVYLISMTGTDDPPAAFDAFAVSFQFITNPSPEPSPTLPPPPTPTPTASPTPGGASPSPGATPTPGEGPGPGGTPPPV